MCVPLKHADGGPLSPTEVSVPVLLVPVMCWHRSCWVSCLVLSRTGAWVLVVVRVRVTPSWSMSNSRFHDFCSVLVAYTTMKTMITSTLIMILYSNTIEGLFCGRRPNASQ